MNTQIIIERFNEYASQGDVFCQEMLKSIKKNADYDGAKPEENPYSLLALVLRDDAEQGDADAQYSLGLFFLTEKAQQEEINPKEAIKWLHLAASQGHEKAQLLLASMHLYFTKEVCGLDEEESMSWIQRAVEQGNIVAKGLLGALNNDIEIITSAAEAGDPSAYFNLDMAYSRGTDIEADKQKAFRSMLKAAKAGYSVAQRYVAYDYYTGNGTHKSLTQAKLDRQHFSGQFLSKYSFKLHGCFIPQRAIDSSIIK